MDPRRGRHPNPVRLRDFRLVTEAVARDRAVAERRGRVLILTTGTTPLHPTPEAVLALDRSIPADVAVEAIPVGLISYGLGPDARIVDLAGLADPVGGRRVCNTGAVRATRSTWVTRGSSPASSIRPPPCRPGWRRRRPPMRHAGP